MKLGTAVFSLLVAISFSLAYSYTQGPSASNNKVVPNVAVPAGRAVRVAIVGLVHDHALGILDALRRNHNVTLVGIAEPDKKLVASYAQRFSLASTLFYPDETSMIEATHPDAVLVYTSILDHRKV